MAFGAVVLYDVISSCFSSDEEEDSDEDEALVFDGWVQPRQWGVLRLPLPPSPDPGFVVIF